MLDEQTFHRIHQMKLHGFSAALTEQLESSDYTELSFEERIGMLVDREWSDRESRKLTRRLAQAKFRDKEACLENLDFRHRRGLDRQMLKRLATCRWLDNKQNIIIIGATGIGKTFLACALAQKACRLGHTSIYRRVPRLLDELVLARADGSLPRLLTKLAKTNVLILDDWGLTPMDDQGRRDLLEVIDDRYGNHSTIIATQLSTKHWHKIIGDPTIADAVCDRLVHNAHEIKLEGDSIRKTKARASKEKITKKN